MFKIVQCWLVLVTWIDRLMRRRRKSAKMKVMKSVMFNILIIYYNHIRTGVALTLMEIGHLLPWRNDRQSATCKPRKSIHFSVRHVSLKLLNTKFINLIHLFDLLEQFFICRHSLLWSKNPKQEWKNLLITLARRFP